MSDYNPFTSPQTQPEQLDASTSAHTFAGYDYLANFTFFFQSPNWLMNWLLLTIVGIIPILGPIVLMGYHYEIIGNLVYLRQPRYPDFDFSRFGVYLGRGIWPFLITIIVGICATPIFVIIAIIFGLMIGGGGGPEKALVFVAASMMYVVFIVLGLLINGLIMPLQLRSGLSQNFGQGFNFSFAFDFLSKVWLELLLGIIFIGFVTTILALVGILALCVGYLFAFSLGFMAMGYHQYQLYLCYLGRGGELIPYQPST